MPLVGLVTVLYKSDDVLEGFIKSLYEQTFTDYCLYLIDNDPNPQTDKVLMDLLAIYPIQNYKHIKSEFNYGVAKGNNEGIKLSLESKTSYTLLLNNDIEFDNVNGLKSFVDLAIEKKESIVIPKILFYGTNKIWMAGGKLIKYKGVTIHAGEGDDDDGKYDVDKYFKYAPTCFMLIHNSVFKNVGLMDEKYFVYYDDTDFIYRCIVKGYQIYYYHNFKIFHKVSFSTGGDDSLFSIYYGRRNRIYFLTKNLNFIERIIPITYTFCTSLLKSLKYNSAQREKIFKGLIDGFKLNLKNN
ncbi:glycosyltransferase family 2 protein [Mucilaginibacter sp. PAMB04274]|uniref:glycosyltransferase family 2 protein n=1 Tax=Mucilaginibacter sp. PAMB04274 TaxID=3138568 RepID=UPI0031F63F8B